MWTDLEVGRVDDHEAERVEHESGHVDNHDPKDVLHELGVRSWESEEAEEGGEVDEEHGDHQLGEQERQRQRRRQQNPFVPVTKTDGGESTDDSQ